MFENKTSAPSLSEMEKLQLRIMTDMQNMFGELRLYQQRSELVKELDAAILSSTFSPQRVLDLIVEKCLYRTGATHGQVVLYRQGQLKVAASSEPNRLRQTLPIDRSLCGRAILEKSEQHCPDLSQLPSDSYVRFHEATRSELVVLIQPANAARVFGVIDLEREAMGHFPNGAVEFARLLAGQAAIAIEHARVWGGVKTLYQISNSVASGTLPLEQSCRDILEALLSESDFEHGQILVKDGDKLIIVASTRPNDIGLSLAGADSSICGRYLFGENGHTVLTINDLQTSSYKDVYLGLLSDGGGAPMRSEMIVPLLADNGVTVGALNIESPNVDVFTSPDESFFGVVGNFLSGAITATIARRKRSKEEQMKTAALALTQLGNAAQSFVHRFNNAIGDARGRVMELDRHLEASPLPSIRKPAMSVADFNQTILNSLDTAADAIDDFTNRFNPGGAEFSFRDIDLAHVGEDLIKKYRKKHESLGITFTFANELRVIPTPGTTSVNSRAMCRLTDSITEVIQNLLDNAVRAIVERPLGPNGGLITVSVSLTDALSARLRVTDNGKGIPPRDLQYIFDFGYSTRKSKGAFHGIGLWFCRYYAFQVGGDLSFQSEEGVGSWFELEFPIINT